MSVNSTVSAAIVRDRQWVAKNQLEEIFDILEEWKSRAEDVQGIAFDCGHFLPEEDPQRTAAELIRFLT
jgi:haloacetate dehalogenase